jgi:hypothetical protein
LAGRGERPTSGDPRRATAHALVRGWIEAGEELHAPTLLPYEVANGLTRMAVAGAFPGSGSPTPGGRSPPGSDRVERPDGTASDVTIRPQSRHP